MEFFSIFAENGLLYSTCYPENKEGGQPVDILSILFDRWSDTEYLVKYFTANQKDFNDPFWKGITIDQAVDQVLKEREQFEHLLWAIETKQPGYEHKSFKDVFKPLHKNIYSLNFSNENDRKARPESKNSMLRIYATELEDGSYVISGGVIKITEKMIGDQFDNEMKNLDRVKAFLKTQGISTKEGLEAI
jgi:hypothetical protein